MPAAIRTQIDILPMSLADLACVVQIMHAAYAEYRDKLEPPSGAHTETEESLAAKLQRGHGAVAWLGPVAAASVLFQPRGSAMYLGRLAVLPDHRGCGIARRLVEHVEAAAQTQGLVYVTLGVRIALPQNLAFYQHLGYTVTGVGNHAGYTEPTFYTLRKQVLPQAWTVTGVAHTPKG